MDKLNAYVHGSNKETSVTLHEVEEIKVYVYGDKEYYSNKKSNDLNLSN